MTFLFNRVIFRFYVNFQGSNEAMLNFSFFFSTVSVICACLTSFSEDGRGQISVFRLLMTPSAKQQIF